MPEMEFLFECAELPEHSVLAFTGTEELSCPFRFEVDFSCRTPSLDFDAVVRAQATLSWRGHDSQGGSYTRYVHGLVDRVQQLHADKVHSVYRAVLVPSLFPLGYNRDCRIFQNLSTIDILKQIFASALSSEQVRFAISHSYAPRNHCVQYQESDLAFASRLMEHEGIFYYFEHQKDKSVMVIADDSQKLGCLPGFAQLRYYDHLHLYEEGVSTLRSHRALRPGKVGVSDRRQQQPSVDIGGERCAKQDDDLEHHLHPARSASKSYSERLARVRLEALRATHSYVEASANCRALQPGFRFQLVGHRRAQSQEEYVIVSVSHQGTQALALQQSHRSEADAPRYQATLRCIPRQVPFRPALATPRPLMAGVQTAQVVGPNAEEVHVDDQGRIKLHFHWDRHDQKRDDASSAWVRVSQPWAGNGYGVVFLPRVGHEVLVQFLDGDPERPVVVGRIFNGEHLAPHSLPSAKNISTIRSESTPGGDGFHEIRFDDSAGQEEMFVHAQRNLSTVVRQHDSTRVGANQQTSVGGNQSVSVAGARAVSVGGDEQHEIQGGQTLTVHGGRKTEVYFSAIRTVREIGEALTHPALSTVKQAKHAMESFGEAEETTIHGTKKLTVRRNFETKVKNKLITKVGGKHETVVGGKLRCVVARSSHETVKTLKEVHAQQEICLHSKEARTVLHSSGKVTISVGKTKVVLKENKLSLRSGGGAQILLDGDEITLKAAKINIQARAQVQVSGPSAVLKGKAVSVKGSAQASIEAPKVTMAGSATTDVTGGVTTVKGTPIKLNC